MVSKLEDTLLRCGTKSSSFRRRLFDYLDDGTSLRRLRAASRVFHDLVDHQPGRLFRKIYIDALRTNQSDKSVDIVLPLCHDLTITVREVDDHVDLLQEEMSPTRSKDRRASWSRSRSILSRALWHQRRGSLSSLPSSLTILNTRASWQPPSLLRRQDRRDTGQAVQEYWTSVFSHSLQLRTLTLQVHGDPAWPGRTRIEDTLIVIRSALEQATPPHLNEFRLHPIHAMGIVHLRFTSLASFGQPVSVPSFKDSVHLHYPPSLVWNQLSTLDLQVLNPFIHSTTTPSSTLSPAQALMFTKVLYDYLKALSATLRSLHFVWLNPRNKMSDNKHIILGNGGPGPLTLHTSPGLENRSPLTWPRLEELWIGGVEHPYRTIQLLATDQTVAPSLRKLLILREGRKAEDQDAWIDIVLSGLRLRSVESSSSSVYSRSVRASSTLLPRETSWGSVGSPVSETSRIVPFVLDLNVL